jgi:uncharacterized membrane protein
MHFANPPSWWLGILIAVAIAATAFLSYRRPLAPLSPKERATLTALRAASLLLVALFLARPIVLAPPVGSKDAVVPILVDVSRSMRVADADGRPRIAQAADLVRRQLVPALHGRFATEVYGVGDSPSPVSPDDLSAAARQSDLTRAVTSIRDKYRGSAVAGIIVVSDGGDTGNAPDLPEGPPVFAVGVGSPDGVKDREILGITAGDPHLDQSSVDLQVSVESSHYGRAPFDVRLVSNGKVLETRKVTPAADGSPIETVFTVSPDPQSATVYTVEVPAEADEVITENNTRSVLVNPAGRRRRVLLLAGSPGYEHSFLARALTIDPGLETDVVVKKGKNESGEGTFLVQAGAGRASTLTSGFPSTREALFGYDALVIANIEGDFFSRAQLQLAAEFASERGGGLLVLGGRSFAARGLIGSPLEAALPVELNDRRAGLASTRDEGELPPAHNAVTLTVEGEKHPVTRIGSSIEQTRELWAALPRLSASAPLGGPKPGASVLAVTVAPGGAVYPVIAVQRYGRGRSMIFAGEASWRWRMMLPASDRSHEFFWRHAVRWLAGPAPDQVTIEVPDGAEPGDAVDVGVDVRDNVFKPAPGATITATLTSPGGKTEAVTFRHEAGSSGRFTAAIRPDSRGLYRVSVDARQGSTALGQSAHWFFVGGGDREFTNPRLNEGWLRRIARQSGGRYVRAADASEIASWLESTVPTTAEPVERDAWNEPWAILLVILVLSVEWTLRRRWGLR